MMRVLPDRVYDVGADERDRWLPFGKNHPAKLSVPLCRDLFLRYSRPGQWWLDPHGGVGTALIGITLPEPRNVVLHELEEPYVADQRRNLEHLTKHSLPGMVAGEAHIYQGDSRHLPFPDAGCDGVMTSPTYAETVTYQRAGAGGEGVDLYRQGFTAQQIAEMRKAGDPRVLAARRGAGYSRSDRNVGNLPYRGLDGVVSSPVYGGLASRDRSKEPSSINLPDDFKRKYGKGEANRQIDGYGQHSPGQIGDLPYRGFDGVTTSPVYQDARAGWPCKGENIRYSPDPANIGNAGPEDWATACLQIYAECYRVCRDGAVLVLVVGDYVRDGAIVPITDDTLRLATAAGWTPVERWRALKTQVSMWRKWDAMNGRPTIAEEHVLVLAKGEPGWDFTDLEPTRKKPADLSEARALVGLTEAIGVPLPGFEVAS